jgi:hypothetical protein
MKVVFGYRWNHHEPVYGHEPYLWTNITLLDAPKSTIDGFNKYLLSALETDYLEHHAELADAALEDIGKLERGEIQTAEWGGNGFCHSLTSTTVTFEHAIFGECLEWPIWSCTLAQYKAALQGWRKFIDMPKIIDAELIVELPDDIL